MGTRQRVGNAITWAIAFIAVFVWNAPTHAAATQAAFIADANMSSCAYVVQSGDWLSKIAPRFGLTWRQLYAMNTSIIGADPNRLRVGMVLTTCGGSSTQATTPIPHASTASGGIYFAAGEICKSSDVDNGPIFMWKVPPGCYAGVYTPNPANYPKEPGQGWCNWWAEVLHPQENIFAAPQHLTPKLGAAVKFVPGEQGASSVGHWAGEVIWISPGAEWVLVSEMNMYWRGGGFGKVTYRYVKVDLGKTTFIY